MKLTRTGQRRAAAINSVKILLTSASLAATLGGWAAINAPSGSTLEVAQVVSNVTATATVAKTSATSGSSTGNAQLSTGAAATSTQVATAASTATVAPTATAVPTQVVLQPNIRTRSSK
jgi:hypothetical protein